MIVSVQDCECDQSGQSPVFGVVNEFVSLKFNFLTIDNMITIDLLTSTFFSWTSIMSPSLMSFVDGVPTPLLPLSNRYTFESLYLLSGLLHFETSTLRRTEETVETTLWSVKQGPHNLFDVWPTSTSMSFLEDDGFTSTQRPYFESHCPSSVPRLFLGRDWRRRLGRQKDFVGDERLELSLGRPFRPSDVSGEVEGFRLTSSHPNLDYYWPCV